MNANELRPLLVEYRSQVEQAWTVGTAHPDFAGKSGHPVGQCGSTSVWLQKRLAEDHGIKTHFAEGMLFARAESLHHCWLETQDYRLVIDLTADQQAVDHPVVCDTHWTAWSLGLEYVVEYFHTHLDNVDLLHRASLLAEAVTV